MKIQKLLQNCGDEEEKEESEVALHRAISVLGIALVAISEDIGTAMALRAFNHLLQYGNRHAIRFFLLFVFSTPRRGVYTARRAPCPRPALRLEPLSSRPGHPQQAVA
jgi:hypothetical protein